MGYRVAAVGAVVAAGLAIGLLRAGAAEAAGRPCPGDNAGLSLAPGFCATIFADGIGHARHMAVAPDGTVYVNTWSGAYYHDDTPPTGGMVVALRDTKGAGRADVVQRFGGRFEAGAAGGTGIALYHGFLYVEEHDRIERYALPSAGLVPQGGPQVVVSGLPLGGDHPMHPFAIDAAGHLYVDLGSATNACQAENRMPEVPGQEPCAELETRGGIWRYDANRLGQRFSPAGRFATGLRNGEGLSFDAAGRLFATQHGRDQLAENWPRLYKPRQGAELPAEELVLLRQGGDYGWPECYDDGLRKKLVLAPEYGGDGGGKIGPCAGKQAPVAAFPAHWAPNDLLIYQGRQFPAPYRGGAFIAFHGSWNRAPFAQGGYNVVFQPLADGQASGPFIVFADGFAGPVKEPDAPHRPTGLAVGPDGALYVADDAGGRIWRIAYQGPETTRLAGAPAPAGEQASAASALPPEGIHPDAGLPIPPGATAAELALGDRIFHGQAAGGTCSGCHGADAKGSPVGPDLTRGKWLWGDGSLKAIRRTILRGVPHPKTVTGAMPPKGGAPLTRADIRAVAAYVWAIGHPKP